MIKEFLIDYCNKMKDNELICKYEKLAYLRFLKDIEREVKEEFEFVFDETRVDRFLKFCSLCKHVRGVYSGESIVLQDWQLFIVGNIFGWVNKEDGKRRFKTAYIRIARGNAKSTLMSIIALYGLTADIYYKPFTSEKKIEMNPEIVCVAVDRQQANIIWGDARSMALNSPYVREQLEIGKNFIKSKKYGGNIVKLSRDTKNKDGGAPTMIIIDEYHAHQTSTIRDIVSQGKGKRAQCLEVIITTAGEDAENKPCKIEDDYVKMILDGSAENDRYFGIIFEVENKDDFTNEEIWKKSNPILRFDNEYSKGLYEIIKDEYIRAFSQKDPSKIRHFFIKRMNMWQLEGESKYFTGCIDKWDECGISEEEFFKLIYERECYVGLDLSKRIDLTAISYIFPLEDEKVAIYAVGFMPMEEVNKREMTDKVPYRYWAEQKQLYLTEGNVIDDRDIKSHILGMELDYKIKIKEICYDPYSCRTLAKELEENGYKCTEVRQTILNLSEATKRLRELTLTKRIIHNKSNLMRFCLMNCVEISDTNGNIKIVKKNKDSFYRIDLVSATINALTKYIDKEETKTSVYEQRGLLSLR